MPNAPTCHTRDLANHAGAEEMELAKIAEVGTTLMSLRPPAPTPKGAGHPVV